MEPTNLTFKQWLFGILSVAIVTGMCAVIAASIGLFSDNFGGSGPDTNDPPVLTDSGNQGVIPPPQVVSVNIYLPEQQDISPQLQQEIGRFLVGAIESEILAYWHGDASYAEPFYYGDALSALQSRIINYNEQGLAHVANLDQANSYYVNIRLINDNQIEVDTCEYWESTDYNRVTGDLVSSSPKTLVPQTITIEQLNVNSWFITTVSFHTGQSFC